MPYFYLCDIARNEIMRESVVEYTQSDGSTRRVLYQEVQVEVSPFDRTTVTLPVPFAWAAAYDEGNGVCLVRTEAPLPEGAYRQDVSSVEAMKALYTQYPRLFVLPDGTKTFADIPDEVIAGA